MRHETIDLIQARAGSPAVAQTRPLTLAPACGKASSYAGIGKVAVLFSSRAHRNRQLADNVIAARPWRLAPGSKAELDQTLAALARAKVETIVIDGGDGTVRDVLSLAPAHFTEGLPRFAIMPSGKTNALAVDLGIHARWKIDEELPALHRWKTVRRSPLEIRYDGEREARLRGFLFGTGAFVRATRLAQAVHRTGAFNGLGVGLSLAGALRQTMFGANTNAWRRGEAVTLELDGCAIRRDFYMLLGSTLERMPLRLRPFGRERSGLKLLGVDAPPRRFLLSAIAVLAGSESKWLSDAGCKRVDTDSFRLRIDGDFVLDGERFRGGDLTVAKGAPIEFLVPA